MRPREILQCTAHRPYPLPDGPWVMTQTWNRLLFAHWPIAPAAIREHIPSSLEIETFDGTAWIGIVPFDMSLIRMRGCPPIPYTTSFPELNVRTYVVHKGKPGVWFFSLDAANRIAVSVARTFFTLPYYNAEMLASREADGIRYVSERRHRGAPAACFRAEYRPTGDAFQPQPGTLEHWLTERYCFYSFKRNIVYRGDIHHAPWTLRTAELEIGENSMLAPHRLHPSASAPLCHYENVQKVLLWPIRKVDA